MPDSAFNGKIRAFRIPLPGLRYGHQRKYSSWARAVCRHRNRLATIRGVAVSHSHPAAGRTKAPDRTAQCGSGQKPKHPRRKDHELGAWPGMQSIPAWSASSTAGTSSCPGRDFAEAHVNCRTGDRRLQGVRRHRLVHMNPQGRSQLVDTSVSRAMAEPWSLRLSRRSGLCRLPSLSDHGPCDSFLSMFAGVL